MNHRMTRKTINKTWKEEKKIRGMKREHELNQTSISTDIRSIPKLQNNIDILQHQSEIQVQLNL